jgi:PAS domain-containing protein
MVTRFTDDLFSNTDGSDFIVRKWRPPAIHLIFIFAIAFVVIYLTAIIMSDMGNRAYFFMVLVVIIGSLGSFTVFFAARIRDLMLATEFQNAMLASAAQLSTKFCLITKHDGTIVYIDPGFQKIFPHFMRSGSHTIDGLLKSAGIEPHILRQVVTILNKNQADRIVLDFKDSQGKSMPMMVTVDVLPRPKGYFLFRGRDFVENRAATNTSSDNSNSILLAHALYTLPQGALITNALGQVTYVNRVLENWLGYQQGELLASTVSLPQIFQQYPDSTAGKMLLVDYEGEVGLLRKDKTLMTLHVRQNTVHENGQFLGVSAIVLPAEDAKKN